MSWELTFPIKANIVPKRVFYKGQSRDIIQVDDHLIIKKYYIVVKDDKMHKIILHENYRHPNADPYSGEYCIPYTLKGLQFNLYNQRKIEKAMETFNLLNCYEIPYGHFVTDGELL